MIVVNRNIVKMNPLVFFFFCIEPGELAYIFVKQFGELSQRNVVGWGNTLWPCSLILTVSQCEYQQLAGRMLKSARTEMTGFVYLLLLAFVASACGK
jgi:hypothetical protein